MWHIQSLKVLFEKINFYNFQTQLSLDAFLAPKSSMNHQPGSKLPLLSLCPRPSGKNLVPLGIHLRIYFKKMHQKSHFSVSDVPLMISKIMGIPSNLAKTSTLTMK